MCEILKNIRGKSAEDLLQDYGVSLNPPIDLPKLLSKIGVSTLGIDFSSIEELVKYDSGRIISATVSNGDNLTIFYRKDDTKNRQRFAIAHELAHCCLHSENLKQNHVELRECKENNDPKEFEANVFAGELLMPESTLKEMYDRLYIPSLCSLAKIFKVSSIEMAKRLNHFRLPYYKDIEYTYL